MIFIHFQENLGQLEPSDHPGELSSALHSRSGFRSLSSMAGPNDTAMAGGPGGLPLSNSTTEVPSSLKGILDLSKTNLLLVLDLLHGYSWHKVFGSFGALGCRTFEFWEGVSSSLDRKWQQTAGSAFALSLLQLMLCVALQVVNLINYLLKLAWLRPVVMGKFSNDSWMMASLAEWHPEFHRLQPSHPQV